MKKRNRHSPTALRAPLANSVVALEYPLNQAFALTQALMLVGLGMRAIDIDHGQAVIALAEALSSELTTARSQWRQAIAKPR